MFDSCLPALFRVTLLANKLSKSLQVQLCSGESWAPPCACSTGHGPGQHMAPVSDKFLIHGLGTFAPSTPNSSLLCKHVDDMIEKIHLFLHIMFLKNKDLASHSLFSWQKQANTGKMKCSHRASKSQLDHCERHILSWCNSSSYSITPHLIEPSAREILGDWVQGN